MGNSSHTFPFSWTNGSEEGGKKEYSGIQPEISFVFLLIAWSHFTLCEGPPPRPLFSHSLPALAAAPSPVYCSEDGLCLQPPRRTAPGHWHQTIGLPTVRLSAGHRTAPLQWANSLSHWKSLWLQQHALTYFSTYMHLRCHPSGFNEIPNPHCTVSGVEQSPLPTLHYQAVLLGCITWNCVIQYRSIMFWGIHWILQYFCPEKAYLKMQKQKMRELVLFFFQRILESFLNYAEEHSSQRPSLICLNIY